MLRIFAWVLAAATTGLLGLAEAAAQDRFALVIGNSKYRTVTALPNPSGRVMMQLTPLMVTFSEMLMCSSPSGKRSRCPSHRGSPSRWEQRRQ